MGGRTRGWRLEFERFGELNHEPPRHRPAVYVGLVRPRDPVLDRLLHTGREPRRRPEAVGPGRAVDLVGLLIQLTQRLGVVARRGKAVGELGQHLELEARALAVLLEEARRELGGRGVDRHNQRLGAGGANAIARRRASLSSRRLMLLLLLAVLAQPPAAGPCAPAPAVAAALGTASRGGPPASPARARAESADT